MSLASETVGIGESSPRMAGELLFCSANSRLSAVNRFCATSLRHRTGSSASEPTLTADHQLC
jgi:hypothetical protein